MNSDPYFCLTTLNSSSLNSWTMLKHTKIHRTQFPPYWAHILMVYTHKTNIHSISFALVQVCANCQGISLHLLGRPRNLNKGGTICAGVWKIQTDISQQRRWKASLAEETRLSQEWQHAKEPEVVTEPQTLQCGEKNEVTYFSFL